MVSPFLLDTVTRMVDQSQCVFFTRFGTDATRDFIPGRTCTTDTLNWSGQLPASTKMDIFLATTLERGINRIDFHDGASNFGYQDTCVTTGTSS